MRAAVVAVAAIAMTGFALTACVPLPIGGSAGKPNTPSAREMEQVKAACDHLADSDAWWICYRNEMRKVSRK